METHARHITIGIFVLFLVAVGFGVALWLGGVRSDREFHYYRVMFDEPVIGLSIGSPVQYSGITVGEIVALSLLPEDPRRAIARVRVDTSIAIRQDTRAELVVRGITGAAVIQLSDGGPTVPLLSRKDGEEPLILAPRSALASLVSGACDSGGKLINFFPWFCCRACFRVSSSSPLTQLRVVKSSCSFMVFVHPGKTRHPST